MLGFIFGMKVGKKIPFLRHVCSRTSFSLCQQKWSLHLPGHVTARRMIKSQQNVIHADMAGRSYSVSLFYVGCKPAPPCFDGFTDFLFQYCCSLATTSTTSMLILCLPFFFIFIVFNNRYGEQS